MPSPAVRFVEEEGIFPIPAPTLDELTPELATVVRHELDAAPGNEDAPFLLNVAGVPGVGKSTFLSPLMEALAARRPRLIAFDRMMEAIPAYHTEPDRELAFRRFEVPAREAGYVLIRELMARRASLVFEHSSALPAHVALFGFARAVGYRVVMVRLCAPLDAAVARVEERQNRVGRHTPPSFVEDRARIFTDLLPRYRALAHAYIEIENRTSEPNLRQAALRAAAARVVMAL